MLFFPAHAHGAEARAEVEDHLRHSPAHYGLARSRWWLAGLRQALAWLTPLSLPGICRLLQRWQLAYKRGRQYLHSPDLAYDAKMAAVARARRAVQAAPTRRVLVYQDELTFYRRPTLAQAYARRGAEQPLARQGLGFNTASRLAGCLNAQTGQLVVWQRSHFDRHTLVHYYQALEAAYPEAERIYLIQDNWPVHFHPDVIAALRGSRIVCLPLPTYAPWTNPIEKVWRKLYQEVLHLHDFADRWDDLKLAVSQWCEQSAGPSPDLLRYVGLACVD